MAFTKETAVTAGKKGTRAGVPNKVTDEIRQQFNLLLESNLPKLQEDLNQLAPNERVKAIIQLATFVLPRLQAVDLTTGGEQLERYVTINLEDNE